MVGCIIALHGAFPDICGASAGCSRSTPCPHRAGAPHLCGTPRRTAACNMPAPPCASKIVAFRDRKLGKWRRRKGNRYQRGPLAAVSCSNGRESQPINTELRKNARTKAAPRCTPAAPQATPRQRPAAPQVHRGGSAGAPQAGPSCPPAAPQLHPSCTPAGP